MSVLCAKQMVRLPFPPQSCSMAYPVCTTVCDAFSWRCRDLCMSSVLLVQVALASFAFLFSEFVQYSQSRVSNIGELERRWAFADTGCGYESSYHARLQSTPAPLRKLLRG